MEDLGYRRIVIEVPADLKIKLNNAAKNNYKTIKQYMIDMIKREIYNEETNQKTTK